MVGIHPHWLLLCGKIILRGLLPLAANLEGLAPFPVTRSAFSMKPLTKCNGRLGGGVGTRLEDSWLTLCLVEMTCVLLAELLDVVCHQTAGRGGGGKLCNHCPHDDCRSVPHQEETENALHILHCHATGKVSVYS